MKMYRFNYETEEYDYVEAPTTDTEAKRYIPVIPAAQNLYDLHRECGDSILDATIKVLLACLGKGAKSESVC